jgi:glycosyltransferase involved in cell wall biosynthesis
MLASIVISNYNYGRFVAEAIESALNQSYANVEIIVVDDGSTDQSREVIERFGDRIRAIFTEHRGQCACINTGFAASRGDVLLFLDADDCLSADAIDNLVQPCLIDSRIVQCQGYLEVVDETRQSLRRTVPRQLSPSGDYRDRTLDRGPGACQHPYTSGSLWRRAFLEAIFPLPETLSVQQHGYLGPDGYLNSVARLFGRLGSVNCVVAHYRLHGRNNWHGATRLSAEALRSHLAKIDYHTDYLAHWSAKLGYVPNVDRWRKWKRNWADNLAVFALNLMDASARRPRFHELVLSPFMSGTTGPVKVFGLTFVLTAVWCAPKSLSLRLSKRLLEQKLPHLSAGRV